MIAAMTVRHLVGAIGFTIALLALIPALGTLAAFFVVLGLAIAMAAGEADGR